MAGNTRTTCARVGSLVTLTVCVLLCSLTPRLQSQDPAGTQGNTKRTLYLLLRTSPDQTEDVILQTIKNGLREAKLQIRGEPIIRTISPAFVEEIQRLLPDSPLQVEAADDAKGTEGKLSIHSLSENIYEVQLPSNKYVLKELSVEFADGTTQTYKVSSPKDKRPPILELKYPGSYIFRPQGQVVPKKCTARVLDANGERSFTADWPIQNKAYLIILRDFEGNLDKLFDIVRDRKKVANPIDVRSLDQHLFAIASVGLEPEIGPVIRGNALYDRVPDLKTRNVKHVWICLPLRANDVDKQIEGLLKHPDVKNVPVDLPRVIQKNLVPASETAKLNKGIIGQPKWWETTREGDLFTRTFILEDIPALVEHIPSMWQLIVYVFEDAEGRKELIFVKHPITGKVVPIHSDEIITWRRNLLDLKKNANK